MFPGSIVIDFLLTEGTESETSIETALGYLENATKSGTTLMIGGGAYPFQPYQFTTTGMCFVQESTTIPRHERLPYL